MALDQNFLKAKIPLLELSINCQNLQDIFWQLIESSNNGILGIIKTFDQLPKSVGSFLAVDQKFKITQNDINKTFDQVKRSSEI